MKRLFILLTTLGLIFTACESGGDDVVDGSNGNQEQPGSGNNGGINISITADDLIGTWKCIHEKISGEGEHDIEEGEDSWGWTYTSKGVAYDFDFYDNQYDFDLDNSTTYEVDGNKIIHTYGDGESFTITIESFDGGILVITKSSETATLKKMPKMILP